MPSRSYEDDDPELVDETEPEDTGPVTYEDDDPDPGIEEEDDNEIPDEDPDIEVADPETQDDEGQSEGEQLAQAEIAARAPRWMRLGDLLLEYKHWKNPRTLSGLDPESLQALANDIRAKATGGGNAVMAGVDDPLLVVRIKAKGDKVDELVLDGQRRYLAVQMTDLGPDALVPVRDREPEPVEWSEALAQQYLQEVLTVVGLRQGLSAFELSESAVRLRGAKDQEGNVPTIAKIATIIGRSESWVSKILAARSAASSKLLERWRKGEISEEQFRDLATSVPDKEEQAKAADETAAARQKGDKAGARISAKERREIALREARERRDREKREREEQKRKAKEERQAAREAKKAGKGKKGKAPVVKGPQADLPLAAEAKPAPAPAKPRALSPAVIEDLLDQSKKRPPTHDLARGVILGIQVGTGRLDFADLPKQWHRYIEHLSGGSGKKSGAKKRR